MSDNTHISWADATWNPVTGCDKVSPGCDNCYALTMARRLKAMEAKRIDLGVLDPADAKYQRDGDSRTSGPGFLATEHPDALLAPFSWRKPRKVFVNSMSDLFHAHITSSFIASVWAVMALTPQHTYQILTKRPKRMLNILTHPGHVAAVRDAMDSIACGELENGDLLDAAHSPADGPLPNVWLGTSVENQKYADLRIPALLDTPAAVRWISAEPLLGPVHLAPEWLSPPVIACDADYSDPRTAPFLAAVARAAVRRHAADQGDLAPAYLDWVVTGGESGSRARPAHPDWFRRLRDQCAAAGIAYHHKQNGTWTWQGRRR